MTHHHRTHNGTGAKRKPCPIDACNLGMLRGSSYVRKCPIFVAGLSGAYSMIWKDFTSLFFTLRMVS